MVFRHECKLEISYSDLLTIRRRLQVVAQTDSHARDGKYSIRSLYFDTPFDDALKDKLNGVSRREKFRLRYYNGDPGVIHLEKKSKLGGLGNKVSADISADEARAIIDGNTRWMRGCGRPLLEELEMKMTAQGLRPKTIVDYVREPFIYPPGNVRVTLDYDIRTGLRCTDFLDPDCVMIPVQENAIIMEVKWDEFLPAVIRDAIQLENRNIAAYSKYAACRMYD